MTLWINPSNIELRMNLRKFLNQLVDNLTFRSLDDKILIDGNIINYTTNGFLITENESEKFCTLHGIYSVHFSDNFLLANYIGSVTGKQ